MGLEVGYINFMNNAIHKVYGNSYTGLTMFELGNQEITPTPVISERLGKEYYTNRGFSHISVDINGQDGALPLDLRNPELFKQWFGKIDVLTNSGTTEHVEPHNSQYECYSIIHNVVKPGGLMLHLLPDVNELDKNGAWAGHCSNYYSIDFFEMLARECLYEIIDNTTIIGNRCVALKKISDNAFMQDRELFLSLIAKR